jgi:DNA-binding NarL/FixJ family response regulator
MKMKRVLLIDDDVNFAKGFCQLLIKEGYEVVPSSSTKFAEVWAVDPDIAFDLIISDQKMPGEVGSAFLTFLAELEKTSPEKMNVQSKPYQDIRKRFARLNDADFQTLLKKMKVHPHKRLILSGYAEDDKIQQALQAGVIHKFLSKNMDTKTILAGVRSLLT